MADVSNRDLRLWLRSHGACKQSLKWLGTKRTLRQTWDEAPKATWLRWLLNRTRMRDWPEVRRVLDEDDLVYQTATEFRQAFSNPWIVEELVDRVRYEMRRARWMFKR